MIGEAWLDQQSPVFWSERLRWGLPKPWIVGLVATEYILVVVAAVKILYVRLKNTRDQRQSDNEDRSTIAHLEEFVNRGRDGGCSK